MMSSGAAPQHSNYRLTVEEAIAQIRDGRQIILVDDEERENEGDLCMAASLATPQSINFMAKHGRGLICLTLTRERIARLGLKKMSDRNESRFGTNFYEGIEAREGVTTGISAADRATTIRAAVARDADRKSVVTPGHIFPIGARDGGVLVRSGQTEGSVDLARLAGLEPAGVICEIMKDDGSMARMPDLELFAKEHGLGILSIADLIEYRLRRESLVQEVIKLQAIPAGMHKTFDVHIFKTAVSDTQYLALALGNIDSQEPVLVRMHAACVAGDVFGLSSCACAEKKQRALKKIEEEGHGVFVYVQQGSVDLAEQLEQHLQGRPPLFSGKSAPQEAELRDFGLGAQVLATLGVKKIRLLSDNPKRIVGLESYGLSVVSREELQRTTFNK